MINVEPEWGFFLIYFVGAISGAVSWSLWRRK